MDLDDDYMKKILTKCEQYFTAQQVVKEFKFVVENNIKKYNKFCITF